jgi:hypothetical protein
MVKAHAGNKVPSIPDYSTISRRVNKLDIKVNERLGNDIIIIALDSTGIKVSNRGGEWIRDKWWHVKRGYLKIHLAAVDIGKKKVVSMQVTSEEVHDNSKMLKKLVKSAASENNGIKRVIADAAAYDSKKNFMYLSI